MNKALLMQLWIFVIGFLFCNLHKRTFDPVFRTLIALPIGWAVFGICATIVYGVYFSAVSQMVLLVVLALTTLALLCCQYYARGPVKGLYPFRWGESGCSYRCLCLC